MNDDSQAITAARDIVLGQLAAHVRELHCNIAEMMPDIRFCIETNRTQTAISLCSQSLCRFKASEGLQRRHIETIRHWNQLLKGGE